MPELTGIDHVHVYVNDRNEAALWYHKVMGFECIEALLVWATEGGPLTIQNPSGTVHLALFESETPRTTTIAFGASGPEFVRWKTHLDQHVGDIRLTDHTLAWSLYFYDPSGNMHEITTWDHGFVRARLEAGE